MGCSLQFLYLFGFTCRFTWGSRVRKLSQRILKLLENGLFLQQKKKGQALVSFRGLVASPNDPLQPMKALKHQTSGHGWRVTQTIAINTIMQKMTSSWTQTRSFCSRKQSKSTRIPASQYWEIQWRLAGRNILQKIIHSATIFIIPQYPFFLPRSELPKLFSFFPFSNGFGRMWKEEIVEICEVGRVCLSL